MAAANDNGAKTGETILHQVEPAGKSFNERMPMRNNIRITVDSDHPGIGCGKDRMRIAARPEGRVDIDAAIADIEEFDDTGPQQGTVASQSPNHGRTAAASHHRSR